jgi:tRNA dimethylallyltransferase
VIVNADSMQVYAELRIITNRPTPGDEAAAPHRLYGFRPAGAPYSAALWLKDVKLVLAAAWKQRQLPVIVGGTGLYFKALTEGLSDIPDIPSHIRSHYRLAAQTTSPETLYAELARRDPLTAARLRPSDPQRIARALEVLEATNRPLVEWQAIRQPPLLPLIDTFPIAVTLEREELYCRCDLRIDAMIAEGAIDEALAIAGLGLDPSTPAMRAVGLPPFMAYGRGEIGLEHGVARAKTQTRNYAKRQVTWMNSNFRAWLPNTQQLMERTKHEIDTFIRSRLTLSN